MLLAFHFNQKLMWEKACDDKQPRKEVKNNWHYKSRRKLFCQKISLDGRDQFQIFYYKRKIERQSTKRLL